MTAARDLALAVAVSVALGPVAGRASQTPRVGSIKTKAEAVAVTRAFLAAIGVNAKAAKVLRIDGPPGSPIFKVKLDARRELWIGKHTGLPVNYWDEARLDFEGRRPRPRNTVFRSKREARERLWSLARKLGAPPEAKIDSIDLVLGVPGKRGGRYAQAVWVWPLDGLPVFGLELGMHLSLDPEDGVVMYFVGPAEVRIAKSARRISRSEAKDLAVADAIREWGGKPGVGEPVLGYVLPAEQRGPSFVLRLGWAVPIHDSMGYEVAVDAETGKVLGSNSIERR